VAEPAVGQIRTAISADMQKVVGSELSRMVSYPVAESDIRKWALAIYYPEEPPRRFWDEEAAAGSREGGIVAPEDFNPFAWMRAEPKGVGRSSAATDADSTERAASPAARAYRPGRRGVCGAARAAARQALGSDA